MTLEKFEFFRNGSYCYHVMGGVVLFHATIRKIDEDGNLVEKSTVDMMDSEMSVEDFDKMDLVTHIDGDIPESFFPEDYWEAEDMGEEEEEYAKMQPVFLCDGVEGTAADIRGILDKAQRQYFMGLREFCPQAILVAIQY